MKIGILSDTHGLLRPEALKALQGVDLILHAGDVGDAAILEALSKLAPVQAIQGNIDIQGPCANLPAQLTIQLQGLTFLIIHDIATLPSETKADWIIYGHSHRPAFETQAGIHYLNPGSAGKRRFSLPISLVIMEIHNGQANPQFINLLDERPLP